jgi:hypothetical protein
MVKEHYSDAVNCALSEYITPAKSERFCLSSINSLEGSQKFRLK